MEKEVYDAIVVITVDDFRRIKPLHRRMVELLPVRRVIFCGNREVGEALQKEIGEGIFAGAEEKVVFQPEDEILPMPGVRKLWEALKERYKAEKGEKTTGVGWYYQQFLKMAYAFVCPDRYYLTWDGDTVPCKLFSMFSQNGIPYFDYKREQHEEYFVTLERLLHLKKVMAPSFISEHMLFCCDYVKEMLECIEKNTDIQGTIWWEKILYSIRPEKLLSNSFSEFETYGTYVAVNHPEAYRLREWHSLRYAAFFFATDGLCDRDWNWLGKDFQAISFERNMGLREDTQNLFNNPRYQEKLTARQLLEIIQEEFEEGDLFEVWDDNRSAGN